MRLLLVILVSWCLSASSQVIRADKYYVGAASAASNDLLLDSFPTASAAYSVARKLDKDYSGSCIRVRRSSDNTESDIGFVNNVLDTATLKTFITSNNGFIVKIYDQSGNTNDASQSTAANQAGIVLAGVIYRMGNNNIPTANYDGTDFYNMGSTVPSNADYSIFDVRARSSTGVEITTFSNNANSAPYAALQFTEGNVYTTDNSNYVGGTDGLTGIRLFTTMRISAALSIYRNGSSVSGLSGAFGGATTFNAIGRRAGSTSTGKISEMIYYPSDKSSTRAAIQTNINNFYGVY